MMRAAVVSLLALGCNASFVAAIAPETDGNSGSASSAGTTEAAATSGTSADGGESTEPFVCDRPTPLAGCDAAADPLRAPEVACYDGIAAARFESLDPAAWRRARELGNAYWVSTESEAVLVLSTGTLPEPGVVGEVNLESGVADLAATNNDNPDGAALPGGIDGSALGSAFGGAPQDLIWFSFEATVPEGASGYSIRVGFLSAAYPEDLEADVSDLFVWWHDGESFTGNLALWNESPANVQGLGPRMHEFSGDHPNLLRTGMDGAADGEPLGASTGWMQLRGPAEPGEVVRIVAALFDQSALDRDTIVTLDGFAWECDACTPGLDCGLQ